MHETPHAELSRKLQNIGASPAVASREVAHAMAMSPTSGADYLKCLGLDYLDCFRLLSLVTKDEIQSSRDQGEGLVAVLVPRRLTRAEYLLRYVFVTVGLILIVAYAGFARIKTGREGFAPVACLFLLALYKIWVLDAARFRDRGKPGFWACVMILPLANVIAQFYLWFAA